MASTATTGSIAPHDDASAVQSEIAQGLRDQTQTLLMLEAVKDAQATIRGIDTKVGILLAALAIPLPYVIQAASAMRQSMTHFGIAEGVGLLALIAYVIAGFIAIRALMGTGNAGIYITTPDERPPDAFYLGGLYRLGWRDAAYNRGGHASRRRLEEVLADVPVDTAGTLRLLVMELMIVAFIRDLKIYRQRVAFELTAMAFVLALVAILI